MAHHRLRIVGLAALVSAAAGTLHAAPVAAQLTAADSADVLLRTAQSFQDRGRWEIAEALYLHILERWGEAPAAGEARARLSAPQDERSNRAGRVELQVWSTMYGLWLGAALPAALGSNDEEAYGVGLLVGGPAGVLAARRITTSRSLSDGQTRSITWGGTWGTWQGFGWARLLDLGEGLTCDGDFCYETDDSVEETFAAMIVGGAAGIATGALLARRPIRLGTASGAHYGSLWGTWLGFGTGVLADADEESLLAAALIGGNTGLIAGGLLAGRHDMSRNRIRLVSLGGLLGGLGGAGLDLIVQPDDERVAMAIPLAASLAGLAVAAHVTRDYDRAPFETGNDDAPSGFLDRLESGGALVQGRQGSWTLAAPLPRPVLLPVDDRTGRTRWRAGLSIRLLHAVF
jgi:hypothetical protein